MSITPESSSRQESSPGPGDDAVRPPWSRWIEWITLTVCGLLVASSFLPLLPVNWWWIRIGDFPRLQLMVACLGGIVALLPYWSRRRTWVVIGLLAVSVGIQMYWIFPYLPIAPIQVEAAESERKDSRLRIMTANVLQSNEDATALLRLIDEQAPDILVLCEVNQRWIDDLASLEDRFSFHLTHPQDDTYGIAMYSNLEVTSAQVRTMVKDHIPSIDARVRLRSGHELRLFAVHPNPPRPGEDTTKRDAELVLVGREVRNEDSAIVLGDMNDVGWSRTTNLFQEVSRLLDPRHGRGMYATYNAKSFIWRYPLDYLFHSDDFRVVELQTLPYIGSDHFPLLVELSHEPDAKDTQEAPDLDSGDQEDAEEAVEKAKKKVSSDSGTELSDE